MTALQTGLIVFACVFGGALLGLYLRAALPEHHLSAETRDLVRLGMGLIITMCAITLGLLIATTKSSYDTQKSEIVQMSARAVLLDRVLAHYGPEANQARELLRGTVANALDLFWRERSAQGQVEGGEALFNKIQELAPENESQRSLKTRAEGMVLELGQTRWLLVAQSGSSIPAPFLIALVFWLSIIFVSFGLTAPRNIVTLSTLFVCSLSVSLAIFMVLELDQAFDGLIQISKTPLQNALTHLGK